MDWVYLVLILAFSSWSFQMAFAYKRHAGRVDELIDQALRTQAEVDEDAQRHESRARALHEEQTSLAARVSELEGKESELQGRISGQQESDASRRPTRHRIGGSDSEA
jgi:hypothetical protein